MSPVIDEDCVICGETLDGLHQASCQMCGGTFHYPWSQESGVPPCGRIASRQDSLAVVFLCNDCYSERTS